MTGDRDPPETGSGVASGRLPGEFEIIERHFAPLAAGAAGALGLRDDGAVVEPGAGEAVVLTTDCLVAGVHFLPDDPPDLVARKALRVNLSDLAAMGARPVGYLVSLMLDPAADEAWIAGYAAGLAEDQRLFGIALYGGDTVRTPGPLALSVTAFGIVGAGDALRRNGARPGDLVFVTGDIGGGLLGLRAAQGEPATGNGAERDRLLARYRLPEPRIGVGRGLVGVATAALDVSDGLVADLGHVASASGVAIEVDFDAVPFDPAAASGDTALRVECLAGGDDYEIAFCAPADQQAAVAALAANQGVPITAIGWVVEGRGVTVLGAGGRPMQLGNSGFRHF